MAYELVQLPPSTQAPQNWKGRGIIAGILFVAGWAILGSVFVGVFWALVSLAVAGISGFIKRKNQVFAEAKADLARRGFQVDFQVGRALIASQQKKIAFVNVVDRSYDLYSAYDILGWEHTWTNHTDTTALGSYVRSQTQQIGNVLVFKTNNPSKPMYQIPVKNHQTGQQWMARLGAIING